MNELSAEEAATVERFGIFDDPLHDYAKREEIAAGIRALSNGPEGDHE